MLTASLQSTWDTQKNRQGRSKYGSQATGYATFDDGENKGNPYGSLDRTLGKSTNYSAQQAQAIAYNPNAANRVGGADPNANSSELPNLKVPQVNLFYRSLS